MALISPCDVPTSLSADKKKALLSPKYKIQSGFFVTTSFTFTFTPPLHRVETLCLLSAYILSILVFSIVFHIACEQYLQESFYQSCKMNNRFLQVRIRQNHNERLGICISTISTSLILLAPAKSYKSPWTFRAYPAPRCCLTPTSAILLAGYSTRRLSRVHDGRRNKDNPIRGQTNPSFSDSSNRRKNTTDWTENTCQ